MVIIGWPHTFCHIVCDKERLCVEFFRLPKLSFMWNHSRFWVLCYSWAYCITQMAKTLQRSALVWNLSSLSPKSVLFFLYTFVWELHQFEHASSFLHVLHSCGLHLFTFFISSGVCVYMSPSFCCWHTLCFCSPQCVRGSCVSLPSKR